MVSKTKKKLTFNETVKETGLGLAVIIFQDKLQKKFWDKLTFDQWVQIFRQVPSDSNLKNTALTKMLELASTFEHWHRIYKKHLLDEKTKKTALTQMLKLASNFDQCKEVLSEFDAPSKKERNMVLKMAEMASTFDQCLFICDVAYSRSKGKMIALKKMRKLKVNFHQLLKGYKEPVDKEAKEIIFEKLLKLKGNFNGWKTVVRETPDEDRRGELALRKMISTATTLDELMESWEFVYDDEQLERAFLNKIRRVKAKFSKWAGISFGNPATSTEEELQKIILAKMLKTATYLRDWLEILRQEVYPDSKPAKTALRKILELASTFREWQEVWREAPEGSELKEIALTKMSEFTTT